MKPTAVASAPGKIILTGEHAVVLGQPALAMAIDKRVRASVSILQGRTIDIMSKSIGSKAKYRLDRPQRGLSGATKLLYPCLVAAISALDVTGIRKGLRIALDSELPLRAGLGSSAATAVAIAAAVGKGLNRPLSEMEISDVALQAERVVHGEPSGIDNTVSTVGGAIIFRRKEGFTSVECPAGLELVVGCSRQSRSTKEQVAKVASFVRKHDKPAQLAMAAIGRLTEEASEALRNGDMRSLGELLTANHWLLNSLGVAHPVMDKMVYAAVDAGAYGAKLTGAGGGGCAIALVNRTSRARVEKALRKTGALTFAARLSNEGVLIEAE